MSGALHGKRIVNTRAPHQAAEFSQLIYAVGAVPLLYPCIVIRPPEDASELDTALQELAAGVFDWLVLTSANTVFSLAERLSVPGLSLQGRATFRTAAVGSATAEAAAAQLGLKADIVPDEYAAEKLAEAILAQGPRRILLPQSAIARPVLVQMLEHGGAHVCVVDAYRTMCGTGGIDLATALKQNRVDAVTFTSASTVHCCVERLHREGGSEPDLNNVCIACIGPKTAAAAREYHLQTIPLPAEHTLAGLLGAIDGYFAMTEGGVKHDDHT